MEVDDLQAILAIVRNIGWGAADLLRSYAGATAGELAVENQGDGPVTKADVAVNHFILVQLQAVFGTAGFGYLTEETYKIQDPADRLYQDWVWIIDPLDGTRDFIDRTGEYAIHIALAHQGRPVLAVVAVPETEKLYYAHLGGGAFVESRNHATTRLQVSDCDRPQELTVVVSRSHRSKKLDRVLQHLKLGQEKSIGSVGCKITAIVEHQADVYISISGKSAPKDWDFAAPELILTEAGGQFTRFDGSPLQYNQEDVNQWGGIVASNNQCHDWLCAEAAKILTETGDGS